MLSFDVYSDVSASVDVIYVDGTGLVDDKDGEFIDVAPGEWTKSVDTLQLSGISGYQFNVFVRPSEKDATVYIDNVRLVR